MKSRKSYDSMDCEKKEKYLNAIRNQSAIARQNREISKLHVNVCISQFCQKIEEGLIMYALSATESCIGNHY